MKAVSPAGGDVPKGPWVHDLLACRKITRVLGRIGDKWAIAVIVLLRYRAWRFSELKREVGEVSQRMLTLTLRNLERDGLVRRSVTPTAPPRVDYALTRVGVTFAEALDVMERWAYASLPTIEQAQMDYDNRQGLAGKLD